MSNRLIIEYVLEGERRGYDFTAPTNGFDPDILKFIWRNAMSRGQGWGSEQYVGSRSIKSFPLDDGRIAVSEMTVTGQQDENGRRGIRRAVIDVMSPAVYALHLRSRLAGYPEAVRAEAERKRINLQAGFPKLKRDAPLVLAYPFTTPRDWWVVEALVIRLALAPVRQMRTWSQIVPFTTLALDYRSESRLVAMPLTRTEAIRDMPVFAMR